MGIGRLDGWKVDKKQAPSGYSAGAFFTLGMLCYRGQGTRVTHR